MKRSSFGELGFGGWTRLQGEMIASDLLEFGERGWRAKTQWR